MKQNQQDNAVKLRQLQRQVALLSNARELKYVNYSYAANVATTWALTAPTEGILSGVSQGDQRSERDGLGYDIKSFHLKGYVNYDSTDSVAVANIRSDELFRFIIVQNHQTAGAAIDVNKVLDLSTGQHVNAPLNLQNENFTILHDETIVTRRPVTVDHSVNYPSDTYTQAEAKSLIEFKRTFKTPIKVRASGTTAGYASYQNDTITFIAVSSLACNLYYTSRLRYFDS